MSNKRSTNKEEDKNIRYLSSVQLECALLLNLADSDVEIVSKCEGCFKLLCEEIELLKENIDESNNSLLINYQIYSQFMVNSSIGRQVQQKAIRTVLKQIQRITPGFYYFSLSFLPYFPCSSISHSILYLLLFIYNFKINPPASFHFFFNLNFHYHPLIPS